jgi:hypothetical protein
MHGIDGWWSIGKGLGKDPWTVEGEALYLVIM